MESRSCDCEHGQGGYEKAAHALCRFGYSWNHKEYVAAIAKQTHPVVGRPLSQDSKGGSHPRFGFQSLGTLLATRSGGLAVLVQRAQIRGILK
jgi:hypothetical protein